MYVSWIKCAGDVWCGLNALNLEDDYFHNRPQGVYIIWHGDRNPQTVYVGQGDIRSRILSHRHNSDIQHYNSFGLYVSWTVVSPPLRDGIEAYLSESLRPLVGTHHPVSRHIAVNLPLW